MNQSIHDKLDILSGAMTAIKISINLGWITLQKKLTGYRIAYQFGKGENTCVNWFVFVWWSCRWQSQCMFYISRGLRQLQLTENTTTRVTSIWLNWSIFLILSQLSILFLQVHCSFTHQPLDKNGTIPFYQFL